jgi:WD40 repeat protein
MAEPAYTYDVFLSHAGEDDDFVKRLADDLERAGATVFDDARSVKPGENILEAMESGLKKSRKIVFVMSQASLSKSWPKAEMRDIIHDDPNNSQRRLVPLKLEDCDPPSFVKQLKPIDFRNREDYPIRFRELMEALDLLPPKFESREREKPEFEERELRGREAYKRGKAFEQEVATLYKLLGFEVGDSQKIDEIQIDLTIHQKRVISVDAAVECKDLRVTAKERDQIIAASAAVRQKHPAWRMVVVSSRGFSEDSRTALLAQGIDCKTYPELLSELVPLEQYVQGLIRDYEEWFKDPKNWDGCDLFIRPWVVKDITNERVKALDLFAGWLDDNHQNHLIILSDLGTGKTTLTKFLAYQMGQAFLEDPARHPAPVFIPLREARRAAFDLETIILSHFNRNGLRDVKFSNFEHLLHSGKIILFFDAFDEMADRIRWEETRANFAELKRAVSSHSKVILTCRTHYFKNREEQIEILGKGPRYSEAVTELYRDIAGQEGKTIVNLCEFSDEQIQLYLKKARPDTHQEDWIRIREIYNLQELAHRPLLLDMIVKSLPRLKEGAKIHAADLYTVYTDIWIRREEVKHPLLKPTVKLNLMLELSWRMWLSGKLEISAEEMVPFVEKLLKAGDIDIDEEEARNIVREMHTATFLRRDDLNNFSFIHPSFLEYFLARKICSELGIIDQVGEESTNFRPRYEAFEIRRVKREVVFFISGFDKKNILKNPLKDILTNRYQEKISENALQILYWIGRIRLETVKKIPRNLHLSKKLEDWLPSNAQLAGANLEKSVLDFAPLIRANLQGADLSAANLNNADFTETNLSHANLKGAKCIKIKLTKATLENANLRDCFLDDADLSETNFQRSLLSRNSTSLINARIEGAIGLPEWIKPKESISSLRREMVPVIQLGHSGIVSSISFLVEEDLIALGDNESVITLWRISDGRLLRTLKGHSANVTALIFLSDRKTLISSSNDKTIRLWNIKTENPINTFIGHSKSVSNLAISPNEKILASASWDNTIRIWDTKSGTKIRTLQGTTEYISTIVFTDNGKTLLAVSKNSTLKKWDVNTGKLVRTLRGQVGASSSLAFSPDGKTILSGGDDGAIKQWNSQTGEEIRTFQGHLNTVEVLSFSCGGKIIASGSWDRTVRLWDAMSGDHIRTIQAHTGSINRLVFASNGETLASGSLDRTVKLWDINTGKTILTLNRHSNSVNCVTFSPSGRKLVSGNRDAGVKVWNISNTRRIRFFKGHAAAVSSIAFAPYGNTIISGSINGIIIFWDAKTGQNQRISKVHFASINALVFAPDGNTLAIGSGKTIQLKSTITEYEKQTLDGHLGDVEAVVFTPDGNTLASGSRDKTIKLWNVRSGESEFTLKGHTAFVSAVAFACDGKTLASGSGDQTIKLWDVESGKELRTLKGHVGDISTVTFAYDGKALASGSRDSTVRLWNIKNGNPSHIFVGHTGPVTTLAFSPQGNTLVSGGLDGSVRLWSVETGREICAWYLIAEGVWLVVLPDGRFNASPAGMQYLCYTEKNGFNSYTAEELVKQFYRPEEVQAEIQRYLGK